MIFTDLHVHSRVSPDSREPMEQTARRAIQRGVDILCFTDHCDPIDGNTPDTPVPGFYEDWAESYRQFEAVQAAYGGEIELLHGMELGESFKDVERSRRCADAPGLDFLIGSVHAVTGQIDFYWMEYRDMEQCLSLTEQYLDDTIQMAETGLLDVVGHLGYVNRYMGRQGFYVDMMDYEEKLRRLFSILIPAGRGIELNTSGLRQGLGEAFPNLAMLKLYRACGGEIVTMGSDAHRAADVGSNLAEGAELLREAGFRYLTVFRKRKPDFIRL